MFQFKKLRKFLLIDIMTKIFDCINVFKFNWFTNLAFFNFFFRFMSFVCSIIDLNSLNFNFIWLWIWNCCENFRLCNFWLDCLKIWSKIFLNFFEIVFLKGILRIEHQESSDDGCTKLQLLFTTYGSRRWCAGKRSCGEVVQPYHQILVGGGEPSTNGPHLGQGLCKRQYHASARD